MQVTFPFGHYNSAIEKAEATPTASAKEREGFLQEQESGEEAEFFSLFVRLKFYWDSIDLFSKVEELSNSILLEEEGKRQLGEMRKAKCNLISKEKKDCLLIQNLDEIIDLPEDEAEETYLTGNSVHEFLPINQIIEWILKLHPHDDFGKMLLNQVLSLRESGRLNDIDLLAIIKEQESLKILTEKVNTIANRIKQTLHQKLQEQKKCFLTESKIHLPKPPTINQFLHNQYHRPNNKQKNIEKICFVFSFCASLYGQDIGKNNDLSIDFMILGKLPRTCIDIASSLRIALSKGAYTLSSQNCTVGKALLYSLLKLIFIDNPQTMNKRAWCSYLFKLCKGWWTLQCELDGFCAKKLARLQIIDLDILIKKVCLKPNRVAKERSLAVLLRCCRLFQEQGMIEHADDIWQRSQLVEDLSYCEGFIAAIMLLRKARLPFSLVTACCDIVSLLKLFSKSHGSHLLPHGDKYYLSRCIGKSYFIFSLEIEKICSPLLTLTNKEVIKLLEKFIWGQFDDACKIPPFRIAFPLTIDREKWRTSALSLSRILPLVAVRLLMLSDCLSIESASRQVSRVLFWLPELISNLNEREEWELIEQALRPILLASGLSEEACSELFELLLPQGAHPLPLDQCLLRLLLHKNLLLAREGALFLSEWLLKKESISLLLKEPQQLRLLLNALKVLKKRFQDNGDNFFAKKLTALNAKVQREYIHQELSRRLTFWSTLLQKQPYRFNGLWQKALHLLVSQGQGSLGKGLALPLALFISAVTKNESKSIFPNQLPTLPLIKSILKCSLEESWILALNCLAWPPTHALLSLRQREETWLAISKKAQMESKQNLPLEQAEALARQLKMIFQDDSPTRELKSIFKISGRWLYDLLVMRQSNYALDILDLLAGKGLLDLTDIEAQQLADKKAMSSLQRALKECDLKNVLAALEELNRSPIKTRESLIPFVCNWCEIVTYKSPKKAHYQLAFFLEELLAALKVPSVALLKSCCDFIITAFKSDIENEINISFFLEKIFERDMEKEKLLCSSVALALKDYLFKTDSIKDTLRFLIGKQLFTLIYQGSALELLFAADLHGISYRWATIQINKLYHQAKKQITKATSSAVSLLYSLVILVREIYTTKLPLNLAPLAQALFIPLAMSFQNAHAREKKLHLDLLDIALKLNLIPINQLTKYADIMIKVKGGILYFEQVIKKYPDLLSLQFNGQQKIVQYISSFLTPDKELSCAISCMKLTSAKSPSTWHLLFSFCLKTKNENIFEKCWQAFFSLDKDLSEPISEQQYKLWDLLFSAFPSFPNCYRQWVQSKTNKAIPVLVYLLKAGYFSESFHTLLKFAIREELRIFHKKPEAPSDNEYILGTLLHGLKKGSYADYIETIELLFMEATSTRPYFLALEVACQIIYHINEIHIRDDLKLSDDWCSQICRVLQLHKLSETAEQLLTSIASQLIFLSCTPQQLLKLFEIALNSPFYRVNGHGIIAISGRLNKDDIPFQYLTQIQDYISAFIKNSSKEKCYFLRPHLFILHTFIERLYYENGQSPPESYLISYRQCDEAETTRLELQSEAFIYWQELFAAKMKPKLIIGIYELSIKCLVKKISLAFTYGHNISDLYTEFYAECQSLEDKVNKSLKYQSSMTFPMFIALISIAAFRTMPEEQKIFWQQISYGMLYTLAKRPFIQQDWGRVFEELIFSPVSFRKAEQCSLFVKKLRELFFIFQNKAPLRGKMYDALASALCISSSESEQLTKIVYKLTNLGLFSAIRHAYHVAFYPEKSISGFGIAFSDYLSIEIQHLDPKNSKDSQVTKSTNKKSKRKVESFSSKTALNKAHHELFFTNEPKPLEIQETADGLKCHMNTSSPSLPLKRERTISTWQLKLCRPLLDSLIVTIPDLKEKTIDYDENDYAILQMLQTLFILNLENVDRFADYIEEIFFSPLPYRSEQHFTEYRKSFGGILRQLDNSLGSNSKKILILESLIYWPHRLNERHRSFLLREFEADRALFCEWVKINIKRWLSLHKESATEHALIFTCEIFIALTPPLEQRLSFISYILEDTHLKECIKSCVSPGTYYIFKLFIFCFHNSEITPDMGNLKLLNYYFEKLLHHLNHLLSHEKIGHRSEILYHIFICPALWIIEKLAAVADGRLLSPAQVNLFVEMALRCMPISPSADERISEKATTNCTSKFKEYIRELENSKVSSSDWSSLNLRLNNLLLTLKNHVQNGVVV